MKKMSRRSFAKTFSGSAFLLWRPAIDINEPTLQYDADILPETIAGTVLNSEQRELVRSFMENYNRMMSSIRDVRLDNSLSPAVHFASPQMMGEKK